MGMGAKQTHHFWWDEQSYYRPILFETSALFRAYLLSSREIGRPEVVLHVGCRRMIQKTGLSEVVCTNFAELKGVENLLPHLHSHKRYFIRTRKLT